MRMPIALLALAASLLFTPMAAALSEFGIEGMGRVSSRANEQRAAVSPDGQRIVFASDRSGTADGWTLWQARLEDGRWGQPQPLALDIGGQALDPAFSPDGRWLYFAAPGRSRRDGLDLYRAPVLGDGYGPAQALPAPLNSRGEERSPALDMHGRLLFVRDGQAWVAAATGDGFADPAPLALDDNHTLLDAAWLEGGRAVVLAIGVEGRSQLWLARCVDGRYRGREPLALSFNTADGHSRGAQPDASKPGELLLSGSAAAPRAGGLDIYRMKAPAPGGDDSCR